jgi:hypothetical protein
MPWLPPKNVTAQNEGCFLAPPRLTGICTAAALQVDGSPVGRDRAMPRPVLENDDQYPLGLLPTFNYSN